MTNLDIGRTLSRVFSTYGQNLGLLVGTALLVFIPVAIIAALLPILFGQGIVVQALSAAVQIVGGFVYTGVVVKSVQDLESGQHGLSIGHLFSAVAPVLGTLVVVGVIAGIAVGIGFILLVIPGLILATIWAVIAPAVVVEGQGVGGAFSRSLELTRNNFWQVFVVLLVVYAILFAASFVLGALVVAAFIGAAVAGSTGALTAATIVSAVVLLLASALTAPLVALAQAIMFFDLRALTEGGAAVPAPADQPPPGAAV